MPKHKCQACAALTDSELALLFNGRWYCYSCITTLALDKAAQQAQQTRAKWAKGEL